MATVLFAGLWLAYGGMLALCMGMERHFKQVWQRLPAPLLRRGLRVGGWLALGLSLVASVAAWGWAMGPVGCSGCCPWQGSDWCCCCRTGHAWRSGCPWPALRCWRWPGC